MSLDISSQSLTSTNQSSTPNFVFTSNYSGTPTLLIELCEIRRAEVGLSLLATKHVAGLSRLIVDAGVDSPAYKAMLKSDIVKFRVETHFNMIYEHGGFVNLKLVPLSITAPRIACATPKSEKT